MIFIFPVHLHTTFSLTYSTVVSLIYIYIIYLSIHPSITYLPTYLFILPFLSL